MVLMKAADDRLSKGIGTGEFMCVYWPSRGQEAIAAAMGVTLRDDDQLVTTYRGLHDLIGKGVPLEEIYGEMMGRTVGASRGKGGTMHIAKPEKGVMLSTGIVGAGPPVAVGLAMAAKRKGHRPRHSGQLRRRRDQHRVVPRGGQHGRAVGSADGLRLPEQPVRGDDAHRRHDEARARRRPGRRLRHAGCPRRRQRPAGGGRGAGRGAAAGRAAATVRRSSSA